jgi:hypothetical protein
MQREMNTNFWLKSLKGEDHLEDLDRDKRTVLYGLWETGWESVEWTHLAQNRDHWQGLKNAVTNLLVP